MLTAVVICFIVGYLSIAFEHTLRVDKTDPALIMGALCWALISLGHLPVFDHPPHHAELDDVLLHHVGKIAEILIFLMGAMVIVELVDLHRGFAVITNRIRTKSKKKMLLLLAVLSFFLSAVLDNLATTIVLVSLLRRLVPVKEERLWFISIVIIGVNAGGAWSPIGDVTTTMLWIGEKVSTFSLVTNLVVPSLVCFGVPVLIANFLPAFRGEISSGENQDPNARHYEILLSSRLMLFVGVAALIFVPIFKVVTHLPPYIGMMMSLGFVWLVSEFIHPEEDFDEERKHMYSARTALSRIEMSSILFFLGILVAIASLESLGLLSNLAHWLDNTLPSQDIVVMLLGTFSAMIDNVPLVAAAMGMYEFPMDHKIWHFIAYAAGTGGSMLIIGSAAGVAAMGMERIDFIWYLKHIAWLAMVGFIAGAAAFLLIYPLIH